MRAKWLIGVSVLVVVGACGGNTRSPAGTTVGNGGDGGDASGDEPGSGDAGADAAAGGNETAAGGTLRAGGAAGEPGAGGTVLPGSGGEGGALGACVPGIMNTCLCADNTTSFHYCGADGEWDDCICGALGLGGMANAGGAGGAIGSCTPGHTQRCPCPDGATSLRVCGANATWQSCICPGSGSGGISGAGGGALVCTPGEVRRCQATCGTGLWTCNATGTGFSECVCPGAGGANGEGGSGPDGGTAGSAGSGDAAGGGPDGGTAGSVGSGGAGGAASECGAACTVDAVPNTAAVACLDGSCAVVACLAGFSDCDADPANGCEVAVENDPANCGACAVDCGAVANTSESSCVAGFCEIVSCDAGFGNCNAVHADGCEANLDSDLENCGECAAVCSDGVCADGHCQ